MAKAPKALKNLLKGKKNELPPDNRGVAEVMGKGIKGVTSEVGTGDKAALLTMNNEGDINQISLATPFGRPAGIQPLLQPENEADALKLDKFDKAWAENAAPAVANDPFAEAEDGDAEENEESATFEESEAESEATEAHVVTQEEVEAIQDALDEEELDGAHPGSDEKAENEAAYKAIVEEMSALRKQNNKLREENALLADEKGVEKLMESIAEARGTIERLGKALDEKPKGELRLPKWEGTDLQILFPCHKTTNPATSMFLFAMCKDFGDKIGLIPGVGDARISNTRNRLVDQFMQTNANWALFIDDDMIPTFGRTHVVRPMIGATEVEVPDEVLNVHVIKRLLESNRKLIGACYFGRRRNSFAMFKEGIDNPNAYDKAKRHTGEILATEWVATGCLLIHRDVFLSIQKRFPELAPAGSRSFWDYFREGEGQSGGEDVEFCKRAKAAGHQPHVDTGAQCFHVGFNAWGFHNTVATFVNNGVNREGKWW